MASRINFLVVAAVCLAESTAAFGFAPTVGNHAKVKTMLCSKSTFTARNSAERLGGGEEGVHRAFGPSPHQTSSFNSQNRRPSSRQFQTYMNNKGDLTFFPRVTVLGGGNFGLALALVLGQNNVPVTVLVRYVVLSPLFLGRMLSMSIVAISLLSPTKQNLLLQHIFFLHADGNQATFITTVFAL
jgi:hypothetical protein